MQEKSIFSGSCLKIQNSRNDSVWFIGVNLKHNVDMKPYYVIVALAVLEYPVDFNSIDGELIKTIALVGAPKDKSKEYLGLLSSLSKIFRVKKNRDAIKTARDQKELIEAIMEIEVQ